MKSKGSRCQDTETQRSPTMLNLNRPTPRHIIPLLSIYMCSLLQDESPVGSILQALVFFFFLSRLPLCFLIGEFSPFKFMAIIDKYVFTYIFILVFHLILYFSFVPFLFLFSFCFMLFPFILCFVLSFSFL